MTAPQTLSTIRAVFLNAQDVCGDIIRASQNEPPIVRVGFLSADVCLAIAEDGKEIPGEVAAAMADVFHSLSKPRSKNNEAQNLRFSEAMLACERAAHNLADHSHGLSAFTYPVSGLNGRSTESEI